MARAPTRTTNTSRRGPRTSTPASGTRETSPETCRAAPRKPAAKAATSQKPARRSAAKAPAAREPRSRTPADRDRQFNLLLQAACLKAGSAAALATFTGKVPLLGRLAPMLADSIGDTLSQDRIQRQLVHDVIALYDLDLSEPEQLGVELLATAGNVGAQQLSRAMADRIVDQVSGRYFGPTLVRALPITQISTEVAAAITGTYTVGKRAQVLCQLPGSGARNLGELLRGLTGIDQRRLFSWSGEALKLALSPLRGVLSMIPGMR